MAGTWQLLGNQPSFDARTMLLLTDGTVFCQENYSKNWWQLTPDAYGNYVNGTCSNVERKLDPHDPFPKT